MPPTNHHGSSIPFASFRRPILSVRADQVCSVEMNHDSDAHNSELESFQRHIYDRFLDLSSLGPHEFLSASWIQKLLGAFIDCQEEFRFLSELFEKSIKALDICNAARDGIEKIRQWQKHLEIVLSALDSKQRMIGEGQVRRARKALMDLALTMLDERETGSTFSHRNRSFGRHNNTNKNQHHRLPGHSRSLSWSVSRTWSAAKQLQSIANNVVPPRANEVAATNGLAIPVFAMSSVLMFALWALVASIPCQDRGLQIHFSIPRQYSWGTPLLSLYDRIMEEFKKRDRRASSGLLKEIYQMEKCIRHMTDLKEEVERGVQELAQVFDACKNGLDPLEREVREVFRKIMGCRTEGLELLNMGSTAG
ncbi:hypothetical protein NMG60_11032618 [Bertholletia excelsa]